MQNDAIAAALRAAVCAWIATRCGDPPGTTYDVTPEQARETAAAIETFLRALEDGTIWRSNPFLDNRPCPNETLHQLAAAVARAAKENGNG